MAADAREKWSVLSYNGEEGERVWTVTGVNNAIEAQVAPGIPGLNQSYPGKPQLKSTLPRVTSAGFGLYEVTVRYAVPPAGTWPETEQNPISRPVRIRWEIGNTIEPIDLALNENNEWDVPILNSAGDPYDPPITEEFGTLFLHVRKFVSDFDLQMAMAYRGAVNTDGFSILGRYNVDPGQSRCVLMTIPDEYDVNATWVDAQLTLEFRADGFLRRLVDHGYRGWYTVSSVTKSGKLKDAEGVETTVPLRLDGTGKPIESSITVAGNTPVAAPEGFGLPTGVTVEPQGNNRFLKYKTKATLPFAPLLQFFNA